MQHVNRYFMQLWLGLTLLFLLTTSAALAQTTDSETLLRQSVTQAIGNDWQVGVSQIENEWAIVSLRSTNTLGETKTAFAHWDGAAWHIALPDSADYASWLTQLPDSLLSAAARPFLQPSETNAASAMPNFVLPFPAGQTWRYLGGPNGGPQRKAVDFGPLSFNEPVNSYGIYTGREREVTAAAEGVVVDKDSNMVILRHFNGWETVYYSLAQSSIQLKLGDFVAQGQLVGLASDETAPTQTVHVRFWVRHDGADQPSAGLNLAGWTIYADNSYQSGELAGRMLYEGQIEKVDCLTVNRYRFELSQCQVTHYAEPILRVAPKVTRLPRSGSGNTVLEILNVHDLKRIEFTLNNGVEDFFNPFYQVVGTSLGTVFAKSLPTPLNPVSVPERDVFNPVLTFTATIEPPFSGSGSLLNIEWESLTAGETELILSTVHLYDSQGRPIPVTLQDGALQVLPNFLVEGRLQLPGRRGFDNVHISLNDQAVPYENNGYFKIESTGPYILTISAPQYLSARVEGSKANLGDIQLLGGDVTGDDQINIFDLAYIGNHYNGHDTLADLNGDGLVNVFDMALAAANYGKQGPVLIRN